MRYVWPAKDKTMIVRRCTACGVVFSVATLPPIEKKVIACPFCSQAELTIVQAEMVWAPAEPTPEEQGERA